MAGPGGSAWEVSTAEDRGFAWSERADGDIRARAKGCAFGAGGLLTSEGLAAAAAAAVAGAGTPGEGLRAFLAGLNGPFAIVVETAGAAWAAVDRCRSIPLFYGRAGGRLFIGDRAEWVRRRVGDERVDDLAATEFLLAGYVTGDGTLFPGVRQVRSGALVRAAGGAGGMEVSAERYDPRREERPLPDDPEALYPLVEERLAGACSRLLESTAGRTLVVPLSGGHDSGGVAAMLKRLGAREVICFTYGLRRDWETHISRLTARRLGYPWRFVPYTRRKMHAWFHSDEGRAYLDDAGNHCSMAFFNDFPAVGELIRGGQVPDDAVFVPGHGAASADQHLPPSFERMRRVGRDAFLEKVFRSHYFLRDWSDRRDRLRPILAERVFSRLDGLPVETPQQAADALQHWCRERTSNWITNWLRAYEFWGHAWRMPLWDRDWADLLARLPFRLRIDRRLYRQHLDRTLFEPLGVAGPRRRRLRPTSHHNRLRNKLLDPWYGRYNGHLPLPRAWLIRNRDVCALDHPLVKKDRLAYLEYRNGLNVAYQLRRIQERTAAGPVPLRLPGD